MKKIAAILAMILLVNGFSACEKDDICADTTPTTPRLIIEFYLKGSAEVLKPVTNLKVVGVDMENGIVFNPTGTGESQYLTNSSKVAIPLDLSKDTVAYDFTLNATDTIAKRTDRLVFNYSRNQFYVSRACGYKMLFALNNLPGLPSAYILNNTQPAVAGQWISRVSVQTYNIINEDETHIKIYF